MHPLLRLARRDEGAAAIEFGFALASFLAMVFGIIKLAMMLWALGSLHYAAETAARCASVDPSNCGTSSTITGYATSHYYGQPLSSLQFNYSTSGCGHTVTASYSYTLTVPLLGTWTTPLSTSACYP